MGRYRTPKCSNVGIGKIVRDRKINGGLNTADANVAQEVVSNVVVESFGNKID